MDSEGSSFVDIDELLIDIEPYDPLAKSRDQVEQVDDRYITHVDLLSDDVIGNGAETREPSAVVNALLEDADKERIKASSGDRPPPASMTPNGHVVEVALPRPEYLIPADRMYFASTNNHTWNFELYRNSEGQSVPVTYCSTLAQSEVAAARLLDYPPVFGFDIEWRPNFTPGRSWTSIKDNVSLIQVATEKEIVLFHIALHAGRNPQQLITPSLKQVIECPLILKTGVNISSDAQRLRQFFRLEPKGLFELSLLYHVAEAVTDAAQPKLMVGLAKQVEGQLGLKMAKGKVRTSNWSRPLNPLQIKYAASDAYASYKLFSVMNGKRQAMDPVPPMPSCVAIPDPKPKVDKSINTVRANRSRPSNRNAGTFGKARKSAQPRKGLLEQKAETSSRQRRQRGRPKRAHLRDTERSSSQRGAAIARVQPSGPCNDEDYFETAARPSSRPTETFRLSAGAIRRELSEGANVPCSAATALTYARTSLSTRVDEEHPSDPDPESLSHVPLSERSSDRGVDVDSSVNREPQSTSRCKKRKSSPSARDAEGQPWTL